MKGISPIIASVLLIAITMSIAVVLAAYVTSYTREATQSIPSACIGGAAFFSNTPRLSGCVLTATIESQFVELTSFKVDVRDASTGDVLATGKSTSGLTTLAPGDIGTLTSNLGLSDCTNIEVRVSTSCSNVKTPWETPA